MSNGEERTKKAREENSTSYMSGRSQRKAEYILAFSLDMRAMLFDQESEGTNSSEGDASEEDPLCIIGSSDRIIAFAGCSHDRHFR